MLDSITTFTAALSEILQERLPDLTVSPTLVTKNNGCQLSGLIIRDPRKNVAPTFYCDSFYSQYRSGNIDLDSIADRIVSDYETFGTPDFPDMTELFSSPDFIDRINLRLVNSELNRDNIEARNYLNHSIAGTDLTALFYATVTEADDSVGAFAITTDILSEYLKDYPDAESLYSHIISRDSENDFSCTSMLDFLKSLKPELFSELDEAVDSMYIITNSSRNNGAAAILTDAARRQLADKFPNTVLTILPSSIHELIALRTHSEEDIEQLKAMVHEVNTTQVSPQEVLSDNVYHYNTATGTLTIA